MDLGEYIKSLRKAKGLSQEELGTIVGVQRAAVQKWESGKTQNLKRETIEKLASFFGISPAAFFEDNIDNNSFVSDDVLKFALFGGDKEITDSQLEEVKRFAKFVKERDNNE